MNEFHAFLRMHFCVCSEFLTFCLVFSFTLFSSMATQRREKPFFHLVNILVLPISFFLLNLLALIVNKDYVYSYLYVPWIYFSYVMVCLMFMFQVRLVGKILQQLGLLNKAAPIKEICHNIY